MRSKSAGKSCLKDGGKLSPRRDKLSPSTRHANQVGTVGGGENISGSIFLAGGGEAKRRREGRKEGRRRTNLLVSRCRSRRRTDRGNGKRTGAHRPLPGLVNFVHAVAYHFCSTCLQHSRNLGTAFQRGSVHAVMQVLKPFPSPH